jgi:hypothetical protein
VNNQSDQNFLKQFWQPLSVSYSQDLADTFRLIHQACQFIALTGKSVFPARFDDSHTSFFWCYKHNCFAGEWMHFEKTFRLQFDPVKFKFRIINYSGEELASLNIEGKTRKDVYSQLRQTLANAGIIVNRFVTDMHFDLPQHSVFKGGKYTVIKKELNLEVGKYYSNAFLLLNLLKGRMPASESIRCWPHHFDISLENHIATPGANNKYVLSLGFSPSNGVLNKPFYYVTLNNVDISLLKSLPKLSLGKWLKADDLTCYLCVSALLENQETGEQPEMALNFFNEGISKMLLFAN